MGLLSYICSDPKGQPRVPAAHPCARTTSRTLLLLPLLPVFCWQMWVLCPWRQVLPRHTLLGKPLQSECQWSHCSLSMFQCEESWFCICWVTTFSALLQIWWPWRGLSSSSSPCRLQPGMYEGTENLSRGWAAPPWLSLESKAHSHESCNGKQAPELWAKEWEQLHANGVPVSKRLARAGPPFASGHLNSIYHSSWYTMAIKYLFSQIKIQQFQSDPDSSILPISSSMYVGS